MLAEHDAQFLIVLLKRHLLPCHIPWFDLNRYPVIYLLNLSLLLIVRFEQVVQYQFAPFLDLLPVIVLLRPVKLIRK